MDTSSLHWLQYSLLTDETFASLPDNTARVSYIFENLMSLDAIRREVKTNFDLMRQATAKCSVRAHFYITEAKLHLAVQDRPRALIALRLALLFTADQLAKADLYAHLAVVHFEAEDYEAALWAAEMVLSLQSRDVHSDGETIKGQMELLVGCLRRQGRSDEAVEMLQAFRGVVEDYGIDGGGLDEWVAKLVAEIEREREEQTYSAEYQQWLQQEEWTRQVDVRLCRGATAPFQGFDPEQIAVRSLPHAGRFIVATSAIPAGTTIFMERPLVVSLEENVIGRRCSACYHDLRHRWYPCEVCTEAVYCNRNCAQQDWINWHRAECRGMRQLLLGQLSTTALGVFRLVSRVGGAQAAMALHQEAKETKYDIEKYLAECETELEPEEQRRAECKMVCSLIVHETMYTRASIVQNVLTAIQLAVAVVLAEEEEGPEDEAFFIKLASMLVTECLRIHYNAYGWIDYGTTSKQYIANCMALFGSLINHSCVYNTTWYFTNGVLSWTTTREISPGEEVTISYGPMASKDSYDARQKRLNFYNFACACSACLQSAISGTSLKCPNCTIGPVPFDSPHNEHPRLHGRCLHCHTVYEDFEVAIDQLKQTISLVNTLEQLMMPLLEGTALLPLALTCLKTLHRLAFAENHQVVKAVMAIAGVLQRCNDQFSTMSLDDRLRILSHLDLCLPAQLPSSLFNSQMNRSLAFVFEMAIKCAQELRQQPNVSHLFSPRDASHLVQRFHGRYYEALKTMTVAIEGESIIDQVATKAMQQLDQQLVQLQVQQQQL